MHVREQHRPSSTGRLVHRLFEGTRLQLWSNDPRHPPVDLVPERPDVWILHPQGEPFPPGVPPAGVHLVLLDGSWNEASTMAKALGPRARRVSLPMTGESRYWLRSQQDGGRFSTAEALMAALDRFGCGTESAELGAQFELHVYANLRARGQKELAARFLAGSRAAARFPALLAQLQERRPLEE